MKCTRRVHVSYDKPAGQRFPRFAARGRSMQVMAAPVLAENPAFAFTFIEAAPAARAAAAGSDSARAETREAAPGR